MTDGYRVVFESSVSWLPTGVALLGAALGLGSFAWSPRMFARYLALGFACVFGLYAVFAIARNLGEMSSAQGRATDRTHVISGIVSNFVPAPLEGHGDESFSVDSVKFAYRYATDQGGFHTPSNQGGPMRDGLKVRIHYEVRRGYNLITKLEIAE